MKVNGSFLLLLQGVTMRSGWSGWLIQEPWPARASKSGGTSI